MLTFAWLLAATSTTIDCSSISCVSGTRTNCSSAQAVFSPGSDGSGLQSNFRGQWPRQHCDAASHTTCRHWHPGQSHAGQEAGRDSDASGADPRVHTDCDKMAVIACAASYNSGYQLCVSANPEKPQTDLDCVCEQAQSRRFF